MERDAIIIGLVWLNIGQITFTESLMLFDPSFQGPFGLPNVLVLGILAGNRVNK